MRKTWFGVAPLLVAISSSGATPEAPPQHANSVPLVINGQSELNLQTYRRFMGGFRCDDAGNIFFLPAPSRPGSAASVIKVSRAGGPALPLRIAADLRKEVADVSMLALSVDPRGHVFALVDVAGPQGIDQTIVGLGNDGRVDEQVPLQEPQFRVRDFAVFESGDILLLGLNMNPGGDVRVAVLSRAGGTLKDVVAPPAPATWLTTDRSVVQSAGDGNVYFVPGDGPAYAIDPNASIRRTLDLLPPGPGLSLVDVKVSDLKLAAIYHTDVETQTVRWITVRDLASGEVEATYGPVPQGVMCFTSGSAGNAFTLIEGKQGKIFRLSASAP